MRGYYKQLKMYNAAMLIMSVDFFEEVAFNSINTRVSGKAKPYKIQT